METGKAQTALFKALMAVQPVEKNKKNLQFKSATQPEGSGYVDFAAVVEAANAALHPNGLVFSQDLTADEFGVSVRTNFIHESGEVLMGEWCKFPCSQKTPQAYGSTATYAKRYSIKARMGMADEDGDGNAGSVRVKSNTPQTQGQMVDTLKASIKQIEERRPAETSPGAIFGNYGQAKGQPVRGASEKDLRYYLSGCQKTLADPSKKRYHDSEARLAAAIEAELNRQAGNASEPF